MKTWEVKLETELTSYEAVVTVLDDGISIVVGGGYTHVGTLILAEPRESLRGDGTFSATSSVLNPLGHMDEYPLRRQAEKLAARMVKKVAVTGGIHLENISRSQIEQVYRDCETLFESIYEKLAKSGKENQV